MTDITISKIKKNIIPIIDSACVGGLSGRMHVYLLLVDLLKHGKNFLTGKK